MTNAAAPTRIYQCLIYLDTDGWVRGECYKDPTSSDYLVRIEPIPPGMREQYSAQGHKLLFSTFCMMQVPVDNPNLRVILNDEVTYA